MLLIAEILFQTLLPSICTDWGGRKGQERKLVRVTVPWYAGVDHLGLLSILSICPWYGQSSRMLLQECSDPSSFTHCLNIGTDTPVGLYKWGRGSVYSCWPTWMLMLLVPVYSLLIAPGSPQVWLTSVRL